MRHNNDDLGLVSNNDDFLDDNNSHPHANLHSNELNGR